MNKEELKEIEDIIKDSDYKNHYHLHTYFEVEHIDNLVRAYKKQKEVNQNAIEFIKNHSLTCNENWLIQYEKELLSTLEDKEV